MSPPEVDEIPIPVIAALMFDFLAEPLQIEQQREEGKQDNPLARPAQYAVIKIDPRVPPSVRAEGEQAIREWVAKYNEDDPPFRASDPDIIYSMPT